MSIKKSLIFVFIITSISIYISKILWTKINLPFDNSINIIGDYYVNKYNPLNDTLKYITFILIPIFSYYCCIKIFLKKHLERNFDFIFVDLNQNDKFKNYNSKIYLLIIILAISILSFFSLDFSFSKFDLFHEGQKMSPIINYNYNNGLWSSSYITKGLFDDILQNLIFSKIIGIFSIGSSRLVSLILELITNISLILLIYQISIHQNLSERFKISYFLILNLLIFYFTLTNFGARDFPILVFLNLLFLSFSLKNKINLSAEFFMGCLSPLAIFWSIDRGFFLNFLILAFLIFLLLRKNYYQSLSLTLGVISAWILCFLILGNYEFNFFLINMFDIISSLDYVYGSIHPTPFSEEAHASRATKTLIYIISCGIFVININLIKNNLFSNKLKIVYLFLFLVSFIYYRISLGLSDGPHIKSSEGFPELILISLLLTIFLNFIENNKYIDINFFKTKNFFTFFVIFILSITVFLKTINFKKIYSFPKRVVEYVNLEDRNFIASRHLSFIKEYNKIAYNENCVQYFIYESGFPYLLKKPSCSSFYSIFTLATNKNQKKFINSLKEEKSKYIILEGPYLNYTGFSISQRYPLVQNYIKNNYSFFMNIEEWKIFKRNNN